MAKVHTATCENLEAAGFDTKAVAADIWEAFLEAGVFIEGNFRFASGRKATLKADGEKLLRHPRQLKKVLGHFASHPCVKNADVLLYVPDGMKVPIAIVGNELEKPVAYARRREGAVSRYDFEFETPEDEELALSAERVLIGEDIVTTLGSVAGMRSLLRPEQDVHSLAYLLRDKVNPIYNADLTDHYLLEREIPFDKEEFHRRVREEWAG